MRLISFIFFAIAAIGFQSQTAEAQKSTTTAQEADLKMKEAESLMQDAEESTQEMIKSPPLSIKEKDSIINPSVNSPAKQVDPDANSSSLKVLNPSIECTQTDKVY